MTLTAPVLLAAHHELADFDCGVPALDDWLKRRAHANQASGASRTFVAHDGEKLAGYYSLAAGAVSLPAAPGRIRRNMPDPIPVVVLGRLAIDRGFQHQGLGRALVRDAGLRVLQAADVIAIRALVVHAISDDARAFYRALGFESSPLDAMTLMVPTGDLRVAAEG